MAGMTAQQKLETYGKLLIQYRRGMITHDEMMKGCDMAERAFLLQLEISKREADEAITQGYDSNNFDHRMYVDTNLRAHGRRG